MILFVFEGGKPEPLVFNSLRRLFLTEEEVCTVTCKHDLPTLFSKLKKNDFDLFRSLPLAENNIIIPNDVRMDTLFSQIFLFFDYDFQNRIGLEKVNGILTEMLDYFNDETRNGKLYVNYSMVESLKYTKDLPDEHYCEYTVSRDTCVKHKFKSEAEKFACPEAKQYRFIDLDKTVAEVVSENWRLLKSQNVSKANFIVHGKYEIPNTKDMINQKAIFEEQKRKYVNVSGTVAILNSFPLFMYEYVK